MLLVVLLQDDSTSLLPPQAQKLPALCCQPWLALLLSLWQPRGGQVLGFALLCPSLFCSPVKPVGLHSALKDMHTPRHNWAYQSWITAASVISRLHFLLPSSSAKETTLLRSLPSPNCQLCVTCLLLSAIERACCAARSFPKESFTPDIQPFHIVPASDWAGQAPPGV